jgi:hypothetical protein
MVGNFAAALQFITLLLVTGLFGIGMLLYAAHVFVTVAQQTAGGLDEITWPKDPWFDWISKALQLVWLVALWAVPLGAVLRAADPQTPTMAAALHAGVPAAAFWLLFPICLLSSFSAASPLVPLRAEVLGRMARCPGGTFGFYLLTAPVCAAGAAALYATVAYRLWYPLPGLAVVLLVYARLVGRYSRLLGRVRLPAAKPKAHGAAPAPGRAKERPRRKKKRTAQVEDPWAVPDEEEAEARPSEPVETYGLAEERPAPKRRKARPEPAAVEGYDVNPEPPPPRPKSVPPDEAPPIEARRTLSESETPLPGRPLLEGVFTFPWYRTNLGTWVLLTLLFLGWGLVYTAMQAAADNLLRKETATQTRRASEGLAQKSSVNCRAGPSSSIRQPSSMSMPIRTSA